MSESLKSRLIGTIILVMLMVIFLPDLLDGPPQSVREAFPEVKQAPDFEVSVESKEAFKEIPKKEIQLLTQTEFKRSKEIEPVTLGAPKVKPQKEFQTKFAWTLQVGTFKSPQNVEQLVAKLRLNGFDTYTIPKSPVENELTKVFVGPSLSRDAVVKLESKVSELIKTQVVILKYNPWSIH